MNNYVPFLQVLPSLFKIEHVLEIGSNLETTETILKFKDLFTFTTVPENNVDLNKLSAKYPRLNVVKTPPAALFNYDLIFVNDIKPQNKKVKVINYAMYDTLPGIVIVTEIQNELYRPLVNKEYDKYIFKYADPIHFGLYKKEGIPKDTMKKINSMIRRTNGVDLDELV